ncbi:MAG: DNA repair protein RecN [Balneolaceae bacterium]
MITSLYIKDFALIDELEVDFEPGLSILTGQTGAGKSIIIGALHMILGERADTDVIRQGSRKAIAEGILQIGDHREIRSILEENQVDYREELLLRREIRDSGSRAFINDTPVTISVLKAVGDYLVDLHGQHDHQLLLKDEYHRVVLDDSPAIRPLLAAYQEARNTMSRLQSSLQTLMKRESDLQQKTDLYRFQLQELEAAQLDPDELEELTTEMKRLDNAEELDSKAGAISEIGQGDEINLLQLLQKMKEFLQDLTRIEPDFETYREEIRTATISIQETVQFAERYRSQIEFNPDRLEELRRRQAEINRLQKKYNRTLPELLEYQKEIRHELDLADNFDLEIEKLQKEINKQQQELTQRAQELHNTRIETGQQLSAEIEKRLKHLGIEHPLFRVGVDWAVDPNGWIEIDGQSIDCRMDGCDQILFYISTNQGEEPKRLARIASGGEVSRVMLALKSIIARRQKMPVMIFDEIDTGISGRISEKVGQVMQELSRQCQIIAITHQPQIASYADRHYRVEKRELKGRTVSRIVPLSEQERVKEVASLMGGEVITESTLKSARELVGKNSH